MKDSLASTQKSYNILRLSRLAQCTPDDLQLLSNYESLVVRTIYLDTTLLDVA